MNDIMEIAALRQLVYDYQLRGANKLLKYNDEGLLSIYNGVGPDRWPEEVRSKLTQVASLFAPAVCVHDVEFFESDGLDDTFKDTVDHFKANVKIILKREYPLWTWAMLKPSYRVKRAAQVAIGAALVVAVSGEAALKIFKEAAR